MTNMSGVEGRSASWRRSPTVLSVTIALFVGACGAPGATVIPLATSGNASEAPTAAPSATLALGATAAPAPEASAISLPEAIVIPAAEAEATLERLWSAAGPPKGRAGTWTPAVDPDGNVWTASSADDVFWVIDRDGAYLESWGGSGDDEGEFRFTAEGNGFGALVFRPDGGFYVADSGNARIQQFDADRGFVRQFGAFGTGAGEFIIPLDIELDAQGNVYVYDVERNDVQVFSAEGQYVRTAAIGVGPYQAVDPSGDVYGVGENSVLYRFMTNGTVDLAMDLSQILSFATGLGISAAGDLFIASSNDSGSTPVYESLIQLGADGDLKHHWPNGAESFAIDPAGDRIYMTGHTDGSAEVRAYRLPVD